MAHDKFRDFGENPLPQVDLSKVKSDALSKAVDDLDNVTTDEELEGDVFSGSSSELDRTRIFIASPAEEGPSPESNEEISPQLKPEPIPREEAEEAFDTLLSGMEKRGELPQVVELMRDHAGYAPINLEDGAPTYREFMGEWLAQNRRDYNTAHESNDHETMDRLANDREAFINRAYHSLAHKVDIIKRKGKELSEKAEDIKNAPITREESEEAFELLFSGMEKRGELLHVVDLMLEHSDKYRVNLRPDAPTYREYMGTELAKNRRAYQLARESGNHDLMNELGEQRDKFLNDAFHMLDHGVSMKVQSEEKLAEAEEALRLDLLQRGKGPELINLTVGYLSAALEGERAENTDPRIIQHERELALEYATRFLTNPSLGSKDRLTQANQKELDTHFIPDMLREYRDSMAET